jgi:hypothetical protein
MALIASYVQRDIPPSHIYIGEIDLLRKVCQVPDQIILDLIHDVNARNIEMPVKIFCPIASAEIIKNVMNGITVIACERLDDAVYNTWPELKNE